MQTPYWEYFLAVEDDLVRTSRFVEFHPENMQTFGIEFSRILLASSSEVDVIAKELCKEVAPGVSAGSIGEYRSVLTAKYPQFHAFTIKIPRYSMAHDPWAAWGAGTNPEWWQSYNRVKHHRRDYYHEATLSNAILSVSGLFALLLYFYKVKFPGQHVIDPAPRLLVPKYYDPSGWTPASIQWDYGVPDEI